jgi:hypothetical protein
LHGMRHADDVAPHLRADALKFFYIVDGIHGKV